MPALSLDIDAGALAQLAELPGQILTAVATARAALDVRFSRVDLVYPPTAGPTGG